MMLGTVPGTDWVVPDASQASNACCAFGTALQLPCGACPRQKCDPASKRSSTCATCRRSASMERWLAWIASSKRPARVSATGADAATPAYGTCSRRPGACAVTPALAGNDTMAAQQRTRSEVPDMGEGWARRFLTGPFQPRTRFVNHVSQSGRSRTMAPSTNITAPLTSFSPRPARSPSLPLPSAITAMATITESSAM